jgi:DNA-binding transcriptional ArsR family regulator
MKSFDCITALKALGEENRMRIIRLLLEAKRGVHEIAEATGGTDYNTSKHLKILREAGLVEVEKAGQHRLYALASDFRQHLDANANILDLGCCTFNFDKLPA